MSKSKTLITILICCTVSVFWSCASSGSTSKNLFFQAEACRNELRKSPDKQKYRSYWFGCIRKFETVYQQAPSGPWAAAGLFNMGSLYEELYKHSFKDDDQQKAKELFEKIVHQYPDSAYCNKAKKRLKGDIQSLILGSKIQKSKAPVVPIKQAIVPKKQATVSVPPGQEKKSGLATVTGIRYWSNPEYTRVVIDADRATAFKNNLLKKDPAVDQSLQRLYVDLKNSRLGCSKKTIPINDSLLKAARAGQYSADTVRVVIDINSFEEYNIFSLPNPFRIVIDVRGRASAKKMALEKDRNGPDTASIAKQLALGVNRIVIDPGHGGKDYGAPGYLKGVHEKKIVLAIAKKLAEKIRQELACEVILTRKGDTYLTLEERTAIANTQRGDLFISIHANASRNKRAFGIETYFLNLTTDDESITVAARENATSEKNISELQTILNDLLQNAKINESSRLATYVQKELCRTMKKKYNRIKDKGVKRAPFYVLIGAQMPAILIETSFISNKTECQRLNDATYQGTLCDGIVSGIRKYIKETQPTAYFGNPLEKGPQG